MDAELAEPAWGYAPADVDAALARVFGAGVRPLRLARTTLRAYQQRLRGFSEFVCDRRYPWVVICEREFGRGPGQPESPAPGRL